jgi:hypothetical protein
VKFCFKLYALHAPQTIWSWSHHFVSFTVGTIRWLTVTEYLCHKMTTDMLRLSQSQYSPRSWLINWFVTRQMPLMEQELINLPEHLSSPSVFNEAYVDRSIVFCAVFCWQLVVLLCFFLLSIVLSVYFRFTSSDYPYDHWCLPMYSKWKGELLWPFYLWSFNLN